MLTLKKNQELREAIKALRTQGKRIAFVPTMGALHAGHLALVKEGRKHAGAVVVSIFVNPTQFGPNEDFAVYPRTENQDIAALRKAGVDIAWLPGIMDLYPSGTATDIRAPGHMDVLCGASRPGHFDGVATVVKRLFEAVKPDVALFGEKDYQQLAMIRLLVKEYRIPIDIIGVPTVREADGLAMSSRNVYLSVEERRKAPLLHQTLIAIKHGIEDGERDPASMLALARKELEQEGFGIEYLELRDAVTLEEVTPPLLHPARLFIAARLGKTRLIDNMAVEP